MTKIKTMAAFFNTPNTADFLPNVNSAGCMTAEEIENLMDEIDAGNFGIKTVEWRIEHYTEEFNAVKDIAEKVKTKEIAFLIDCANEEIDFAKKRVNDAMKEIDSKNISGAKAEIIGMFERIEYANETIERVESILADIEAATKFEVGKVYITKNYSDCYGSTLLFQVVAITEKEISLKFVDKVQGLCTGDHEPRKYNIYKEKGVECVYIQTGYTLYATDLYSGELREIGKSSTIIAEMEKEMQRMWNQAVVKSVEEKKVARSKRKKPFMIKTSIATYEFYSLSKFKVEGDIIKTDSINFNCESNSKAKFFLKEFQKAFSDGAAGYNAITQKVIKRS